MGKRINAIVLLSAGSLLGFPVSSNCAQSDPVVLAKPGELLSLPPPGTPSRYKPADYDKDARNEWSKAEFPTDGECRWLPADLVAYRGPGDAKQTKSENAAQLALIERFREFVAKTPVMSPPIGVCPRLVSAHGQSSRDQGKFALKSSFMLQLWPAWNVERNKPNGPISYGELTHLIFDVNRLRSVPMGPIVAKDAEGDFFAEPRPTHTFQGFPVYNNTILVVARNERPLWKSVPLQRLLNWQLTQFDDELKKIRDQMDRSQREYDKYTSAEGKVEEELVLAKRFEAQYAKTPEAQEKVRASARAEWDAQYEALLDRAQARKPDHPLNVLMPRKQALEQRLASLSKDDASKPGCIVPRSKQYEVPEVVAADDSSCVHPMVQYDADYYDKSIPRTAMQLLVMDRFNPKPPVGGRPVQRYINDWANSHVVYGLDWQKVRQELMRP